MDGGAALVIRLRQHFRPPFGKVDNFTLRLSRLRLQGFHPDVFDVAPLGIFQAAVEPIELYFAGSPRQWAGTNLAFA